MNYTDIIYFSIFGVIVWSLIWLFIYAYIKEYFRLKKIRSWWADIVSYEISLVWWIIKWPIGTRYFEDDYFTYTITYLDHFKNPKSLTFSFLEKSLPQYLIDQLYWVRLQDRFILAIWFSQLPERSFQAIYDRLMSQIPLTITVYQDISQADSLMLGDNFFKTHKRWKHNSFGSYRRRYILLVIIFLVICFSWFVIVGSM